MDDMDDITEVVERPSFFSYIFNFDEHNKKELLNMLQYTILSIIPILIILKTMKYIIPEEDDTKSTIEISAECLLQILFIVVTLWFSNRLIRYFPTYSGIAYSSYDSLNFLLPLIFLLLTMNTKLGAKINILMDRLFSLWNGKNNNEINHMNNNHSDSNVNHNIRITQPLSRDNIKQSVNNNIPNIKDMTSLPPPIYTQSNNEPINHQYNQNTINHTNSTNMQNMSYNPNIETLENMENISINHSGNSHSQMINHINEEPSEPIAANEVLSGYSAW